MIEKLVKIKGQPLNIMMHQEALADIQAFLNNLQKKLDALKEAPPQPPPGTLEPPKQLERRSSNMSVASSGRSSHQKAVAGTCITRYITGLFKSSSSFF